MEYIPTTCICVDRMMEGGIPRGKVTLVYGESKAGKTTLSLQCSASASLHKLKTLYLDCENNFSLERLSQIASVDFKTVFDYIFVTKIRSFQEQSHVMENLELYIAKNVALIIVDTITSLYRLELKDPRLIFSSNRRLNRQLAYLNQIAKAYNVAIILTSQVHSIIPENQRTNIEPVATRVLRYWSDNILKIKLTHQPSIRLIEVDKHFTSIRAGQYCTVRLTTNGLVTGS